MQAANHPRHPGGGCPAMPEIAKLRQDIGSYRFLLRAKKTRALSGMVPRSYRMRVSDTRSTQASPAILLSNFQDGVRHSWTTIRLELGGTLNVFSSGVQSFVPVNCSVYASSRAPDSGSKMWKRRPSSVVRS